MKVNLQQAVTRFHPNPSYEQVYFEACANSLDAGANLIEIKVKIDSFQASETLEVEIFDNGEGFDEKNFHKFSTLMEIENEAHKGLGRLIYLEYFERISVRSKLSDQEGRQFEFNQDFSGNSEEHTDLSVLGTSIRFSGYKKKRINRHAYISPRDLKTSLIEHFFSRLFKRKLSDKEITIRITLSIDKHQEEFGLVPGSETITLKDIPDLKCKIFRDPILAAGMDFDLYYSVEKSEKARLVSTSICVDDRSMKYELVTPDSIPPNHQVRLIFMSDFFTGLSNSSRQRLELPEGISEYKLRESFRSQISEIIRKELPEVAQRNSEIESKINNEYPHLSGYYSSDNVGLMNESEVLEQASKKHLEAQKKVLECTDVDDASYLEILDLSSRALAEYVVYRERIIAHLKQTNHKNSEEELHETIVPMRRTFRQENIDDDLYANNVWLLDDRFMSYESVLSERKMSELLHEISLDDPSEKNDKRPDIAIIFSENPYESINKKVDLVVVELKKRGIKLARKEEVISQLRQRARKLFAYFPDKINRLWFYGVTDIDQEFRDSLEEDEFKELFSHGQVFYKPQPIIFEREEGKREKVNADIFVMTYEALVKDAASRNRTFLNLLKKTIKRNSKV